MPVGLSWTLVILCFALAYLGLFLPALPDAPFLWVGFGLYQFLLSNGELTTTFWILSSLAILFTFCADWITSSWAVKRHGGSRYAIWAALIGLIFGAPLLGWILGPFMPLAFILVPFFSVVLVECWIEKKDLAQGMQVATGVVIGFLASVVAKAFIITALIIWFCFKVSGS